MAQAGFGVSLIVADGEGPERIADVSILDIGKRSSSRLGRMLKSFWPMFRAARELSADLYHFHDPELIPAGALLRLCGHKVIFDVHEDMPAQIQSKHYIPRVLIPVATLLARAIEFFAARCFNGYIAVNDEIASHFPEARTIKVHNFPILSEIRGEAIPYEQRQNEVLFIGNCSEARGLRQMIGAINLVAGDLDACLNIAGPVFPDTLQAQLESALDCSRVNFLGWQTREQIREQLSKAKVGLVVFQPDPNHINAMPNKLFDYMGVGLPVVASNFPQWRKIISEIDCGFVVDPLSEKDISGCLEKLLRNQDEAEEMGQRAYRAAVDVFNWTSEASRLAGFYNSILAGQDS